MNQWCRLWHDMPNDPKWRTIAKASKTDIPAVISVFIHLMVNASANATERGRTHNIVAEDIANAIERSVQEVEQILSAMQGRVLDGALLKGWKGRQPIREDGAAERAKAWRENKKLESQTQPNATERNRTNANATERPDKDTDTDKSCPPSGVQQRAHTHAHEKPLVHPDFKTVFDYGLKLFPALASRNSQIIHRWLEAGCDAQRDILPELSRNAGRNIGSWGFFTGGVMDAKAQNEKPLPEGSTFRRNPFSEPLLSEDEKKAAIQRGVDFYENFRQPDGDD